MDARETNYELDSETLIVKPLISKRHSDAAPETRRGRRSPKRGPRIVESPEGFMYNLGQLTRA